MEIAATQDGQPANPQALHEAMEKTALDVISAPVRVALQAGLNPAIDRISVRLPFS